MASGRRWEKFLYCSSSQRLSSEGFGDIWRYREGKKNRTKLFCSHFMSFYPIPFIFRGCIGENQEFYWVPRNFGFWPTNEIFSRKRKKDGFRKWPFLGVWCRKSNLVKIGVIDMAYIMDSGQNRVYTTFPNFFSWKSAISADLSQYQKNRFSKKNAVFLIENWG